MDTRDWNLTTSIMNRLRSYYIPTSPKLHDMALRRLLTKFCPDQVVEYKRFEIQSGSLNVVEIRSQEASERKRLHVGTPERTLVLMHGYGNYIQSNFFSIMLNQYQFPSSPLICCEKTYCVCFFCILTVITSNTKHRSWAWLFHEKLSPTCRRV